MQKKISLSYFFRYDENRTYIESQQDSRNKELVKNILKYLVLLLEKITTLGFRKIIYHRAMPFLDKNHTPFFQDFEVLQDLLGKFAAFYSWKKKMSIALGKLFSFCLSFALAIKIVYH